jgi:biopolymer transport protein ExbB
MIKQKCFKLIGLCFIAVTFSASLFANEKMQLLLQQVQKTLAAQQQQEDSRLLKFQQRSDNKAVILAELQQQFAQQSLKQQQLVDKFNQQQQLQALLQTQLKQRSVELSTVFSVTKLQAAAFSKSISSSLSNGAFTQRQKDLEFSSKLTVPTLTEIKGLWFLMLQEMIASSSVQAYEADIVDAKGVTRRASVHQFGEFAALDEQGRYLRFNESSNKLQVIAQRSDSLQQQARDYIAGKSNLLVIDPKKGELLLQSTQVPTFEQRVHQGGLVGYIILGLGFLGLLIASWRVLYMLMIDIKIKRQRSAAPNKNNPLGRVMLAVQGERDASRAELLIDKGMLAEIPRLERCHSLVKLLAAVAPLLGLLGTVTGMIETFQSITLLGTSDPKLMAGGISQALITTVMGLCVAIPLLFCHSFISNRSRILLQLIQQQSLLILSDYFTDQSKKPTPQTDCLLSEQASFESAKLSPDQEQNCGHSALA